MKKIALIIILMAAVGGYILIFNQNNMPSCDSSLIKPKINTLVKQILGQTKSQSSITFGVSDIQQSKSYQHSRICSAKLNFKDGTSTKVSYAIEINKNSKVEIRMIPSE